MHAPEAFLNGAGLNGAGEGDLDLLNTLMASSAPSGGGADERQADEESRRETASKPAAFNNDPDDPSNPNEVREHHLKKIRTGNQP